MATTPGTLNDFGGGESSKGARASQRRAVEPSRTVIACALIVGVLAVAAAGTGLLWVGEAGPAAVTTVHGERVELDGSGLYRHDTPFKAGANRGSDVVTLVIGVPLLVVGAVGYRRGSARAAFLLAGAMTWFLYLYASLALGTAYNALFLIYVALFAASLYGLVLALHSIDAEAVKARVDGIAPRRGLAWLLLASGLVTVAVWAGPLVASQVQGEPPHLLDHYTTMVTDALDLAVIVPATVLAAYRLHHNHASGYLIGLPLVFLLLFLFPMIAAQTAFQLAAGVTFTTAEIIGPMGGFLVLGAVALHLMLTTLRAVD
jgi:hypothetical protein